MSWLFTSTAAYRRSSIWSDGKDGRQLRASGCMSDRAFGDRSDALSFGLAVRSGCQRHLGRALLPAAVLPDQVHRVAGIVRSSTPVSAVALVSGTASRVRITSPRRTARLFSWRTGKHVTDRDGGRRALRSRTHADAEHRRCADMHGADGALDWIMARDGHRPVDRNREALAARGAQPVVDGAPPR